MSFEDITRQALTEEELIPSYHLREVVDTILASSTEKNIKGILYQGDLLHQGMDADMRQFWNLEGLLKLLSKVGKK